MGGNSDVRCLLNAKSPYIICAIHPEGVDGNSCLDFREDPNAETEMLWEPVSASYIDGELVIERSYYNGWVKSYFPQAFELLVTPSAESLNGVSQ